MTRINQNKHRQFAQRETARHRAELRAAASDCITYGVTEWWCESLLPNGGAFRRAEPYGAQSAEGDDETTDYTDDPATTATFLLLVSYALH